MEPAAWHYIMKPERAEAALRAQEPDVVFFGHTHVPSIYAYNPETGELFDKFPVGKGIHKLEPGWKYLINPGSVGQPRDRNPRASYAVYDALAGSIRIRRVKYDIAAAQRKIKSAGLPVLNAERLSQGR
jgi:diadenosine tetraphosphatase ApaH/serine/threonine PP2A family protein phosphatase